MLLLVLLLVLLLLTVPLLVTEEPALVPAAVIDGAEGGDAEIGPRVDAVPALSRRVDTGVAGTSPAAAVPDEETAEKCTETLVVSPMVNAQAAS